MLPSLPLTTGTTSGTAASGPLCPLEPTATRSPESVLALDARVLRKCNFVANLLLSYHLVSLVQYHRQQRRKLHALSLSQKRCCDIRLDALGFKSMSR